MSLNLEDAIAQLREKLLSGEFPPGLKLREIAIADSLDVSRTIARLAMGALEHQGLLVRERNRGSRARSFTIDEIADAIEVRAELEAMAVRISAERGLKSETVQALQSLIADGKTLLVAGMRTEQQREAWTAMNSGFHDELIEASGNWALKVAIEQISVLPLVSAAALIFDRRRVDNGLAQLKISHEDHVAILAAILARQSHRAEALMREHAFRSAQNKRVNLSDPDTMALARRLPGGALIVDKLNATPKRK